MATERSNIEKSVLGLEWIPQWFEFFFSRAVKGLAGADLVALVSGAGARDPAALGWVPDYPQLARYFETLAGRERRARYRLGREHRRYLRDLVGGHFKGDGRQSFVIACAIDRAFSHFAEDHGEGGYFPPGVVPAAPRFFENVTNPPPELGQMTPMAICRRWFVNFWALGRPARLESFGPLPPVERARLGAAIQQTLEDAVDQRELRVLLASWPRHSPSGLSLRTRPGLFALTGITVSESDVALQALVDAAAVARAHVLLLPELSLDDAGLESLRAVLRTNARRFPALTIAGLLHRAAGEAFVNEAVALDRDGLEVCRHEKLEPYTDRELGMEDIVPRRSDAYRFVDTPVGRLVINICRDVRSDVPMLLNRVLGATLLAVPSYSRDLRYVEEEARVLGARQRAITLSVNAHNESPEYTADHSCVYAPVRSSTAERLTHESAGAPARLVVFRIDEKGGGVLEARAVAC